MCALHNITVFKLKMYFRHIYTLKSIELLKEIIINWGFALNKILNAPKNQISVNFHV